MTTSSQRSRKAGGHPQADGQARLRVPVPALPLALVIGMVLPTDLSPVNGPARVMAGETDPVQPGTPGARLSYYDRWETFDVTHGLPGNKTLCVCVAGSDVWAGTDHGLARYTHGKWRTYTPRDGLAHQAVMAIAQDPQTGDLWIATLGGLNRFSGGRFDTFNQLNSGLVNDVVYGVTVRHGEVWAATAAGTSRYQIAQDRWTIFDETNTPMHEIWCYSVAGCNDKVYLAVWGGGLLEYSRTHNRWKDYRDPDGEMEIDLFRNDGLVHDVVASVACDTAGRVWVGTYFGLSTYDGRKWLNFMDHDSPLVSNFVNFVATHGKFGWIATDNGLNASDRDDWWTYRRDPKSGKGTVTWEPVDGAPQRFTTETIFPHNYILGIAFQGDDIWLATEMGVARGRATGGSPDRESLLGPRAPDEKEVSAQGRGFSAQRATSVGE